MRPFEETAAEAHCQFEMRIKIGIVKKQHTKYTVNGGVLFRQFRNLAPQAKNGGKRTNYRFSIKYAGLLTKNYICTSIM